MAVQFATIVDSLDDLAGSNPNQFVSPSQERIVEVKSYGTYYWDASGEATNEQRPKTVASTVSGFTNGDANEGLWRRVQEDDPLTAESYGATGDGTTDDTSALQDFADALSAGDEGYIGPGTYALTDRIFLSSKDDITLRMAVGARFIVKDDTSWTAFELDDAAEVADKRAAFVFSGCTGLLIEGGEIDGDGFTDPGDGTDAAGLLFHDCTACTAENMRVVNVNPSGTFGAQTDSIGGTTVQIRYNGLICVKSEDITFRGNYVENITYDAITARIACRRIKMLGNTCKTAWEGLQATVRYGQAAATVLDSADRFCEHIVMDGNTLEDCRAAGAVSHASFTVISNNAITNSANSAIQLRISGGNANVGSVVANNVCDNGLPSVATMESDETRGIRLSFAADARVTGNTFKSFERGVDIEDADVSKVVISDNEIVRCVWGIYDRNTTTQSYESNIADNILKQNFKGGIRIQGTRLNILGNQIDGNGDSGSIGVDLDPNGNSDISSVILRDNQVRNWADNFNAHYPWAHEAVGLVGSRTNTSNVAITANTWTRVDELSIILRPVSDRLRTAAGVVVVEGLSDGDSVDVRVADSANSNILATGSASSSGGTGDAKVHIETFSSEDAGRQAFYVWVNATTSGTPKCNAALSSLEVLENRNAT